MVGNSGLEHEVSDFHGRHALLNTVVVGTYLRLVANGSHDLAAAWLGSAVTFDESAMPLRKRGAYSKTRRPVLRMTLQPMSSIVADRIGAGLEEIRAAVREFSSDSHGDLDLKTAVWVELADPVVPTSEARVADIRAALQRGGKSTAQHLVEFDELIERSTLAWSSYASQRVQHLAIADASDDELARGTTLLKSISEDLWRAQVELTTGYLNNISFASRAPGPELIASAAASSVLASASKKWRVGIIVPGGNAARSDIEQVEKHQDLLCDVRTVPRGSSDFAARIASALPQCKRATMRSLSRSEVDRTRSSLRFAMHSSLIWRPSVFRVGWRLGMRVTQCRSPTTSCGSAGRPATLARSSWRKRLTTSENLAACWRLRCATSSRVNLRLALASGLSTFSTILIGS